MVLRVKLFVYVSSAMSGDEDGISTRSQLFRSYSAKIQRELLSNDHRMSLTRTTQSGRFKIGLLTVHSQVIGALVYTHARQGRSIAANHRRPTQMEDSDNNAVGAEVIRASGIVQDENREGNVVDGLSKEASQDEKAVVLYANEQEAKDNQSTNQCPY